MKSVKWESVNVAVTRLKNVAEPLMLNVYFVSSEVVVSSELMVWYASENFSVAGLPPVGGGVYENVCPVRVKRVGSIAVEPFAKRSLERIVSKSGCVSPVPDPSTEGKAQVRAKAAATPAGIVAGFFSQPT